MTDLTVLVVGSGGREHALALAIAADPGVAAVHVAPGNPGTWHSWPSHAVNQLDGPAVAALATEIGADLVVIGPEAPLVAGVADAVRAAGIACFGPSAEAARLEGSKQFAKDVMVAAGVPTAASRFCRTRDEVAAALDEFGPPYVVKQDGLAAGKGVIVTSDREAALDHAGACGDVVVEEYLDGPEVSLFVITDGTVGLPLQPAQDFKRVGDDDAGPNTGGMGAYTPLPWAPDGLVDAVMERVVAPTLAEMARRGTPFAGLLYVGLALTRRGLRVVEFNARFGDPETQAVLSLLESPFGQVLYAAATGRLAEVGSLTWRDESAVVVVAAADGYPATPRTGGAITGPRLYETDDNVHVVHAGTALDGDTLVAAGGRVLGVVATGPTLADARDDAYAALSQLDFPTGFWRTDIAAKAAAGLIPPVTTL
ncbi:MAG TPA: phosphoribosylamine--glycine ligase [Propionibacteriaceae bacterium]|nr:phosphoribosylamine--glycine ligase [Propionibacteriaceae bacterium]